MERGARERGFSLVELLVVITIIGILATTVTLKVIDHVAETRKVKARADMRTLSDAARIFRMRKGSWPRTMEDLETGGPGGGSILERKPIDPWGRPYVLEVLSRDALVFRTLGADGLPGGEGEDADLATDDEEASSAE